MESNHEGLEGKKEEDTMEEKHHYQREFTFSYRLA